MHQICVVSPDGPYLMRLVANLHKLAPYSLVRKTLRVGNAATMIHGLMKLLLTKMSVGGITNFIGLTKNADDGMNLLQRHVGTQDLLTQLGQGYRLTSSQNPVHGATLGHLRLS